MIRAESMINKQNDRVTASEKAVEMESGKIIRRQMRHLAGRKQLTCTAGLDA